jgi:hypothetical protein
MTSEAPETGTYFDDTRKALEFALNFEGHAKTSVMSSILAQMSHLPRKVSQTARKRLLRQYRDDPELMEFVKSLLSAELKTRRSRTMAPPPSPKGLAGAFLAGHILAHFGRLERHRQDILAARTARAYDRCACGSPCCCGWRRRPVWAQAVVEVCKHLELVADVTRQPGKRGLSTNPAMRVAIVEDYFLNGGMSLTDIARIGQVVLATAGAHREMIRSYLEQEEDSGWTDLAHIFDQAGITGAFD